MRGFRIFGGLAKLGDAQDLGSCDCGHKGSTPFSPTKSFTSMWWNWDTHASQKGTPLRIRVRPPSSTPVLRSAGRTVMQLLAKQHILRDDSVRLTGAPPQVWKNGTAATAPVLKTGECRRSRHTGVRVPLLPPFFTQESQISFGCTGL